MIIDCCLIHTKQNIMKKLMLIAVFGLLAISCGTKESSISGSNKDSTAVDTTQSVVPSTTDTMTTTTTAPDSMKMKTDSVTTVK